MKLRLLSCSASVALIASSAFSQDLLTGLVGYYDFEADFSNDPAASGPDGTAASGAAAGVEGGVAGKALLLDATSNQHMNLELGFGEGSTLGDAFTLSAWYTLNENPTDNGTSRYFVFEGSENFDVSYGLRDLGTGEPGINDGQAFTQGQSLNISDAALEGWQHVVQTYSADDGTITITTFR